MSERVSERAVYRVFLMQICNIYKMPICCRVVKVEFFFLFRFGPNSKRFILSNVISSYSIFNNYIYNVCAVFVIYTCTVSDAIHIYIYLFIPFIDYILAIIVKMRIYRDEHVENQHPQSVNYDLK